MALVTSGCLPRPARAALAVVAPCRDCMLTPVFEPKAQGRWGKRALGKDFCFSLQKAPGECRERSRLSMSSKHFRFEASGLQAASLAEGAGACSAQTIHRILCAQMRAKTARCMPWDAWQAWLPEKARPVSAARHRLTRRLCPALPGMLPIVAASVTQTGKLAKFTSKASGQLPSLLLVGSDMPPGASHECRRPPVATAPCLPSFVLLNTNPAAVTHNIRSPNLNNPWKPTKIPPTTFRYRKEGCVEKRQTSGEVAGKGGGRGQLTAPKHSSQRRKRMGEVGWERWRGPGRP